MTDGDRPPAGIQFDRADFGTPVPASPTCATCSTPIGSAYFEAGGKILCEACRYRLEEFLQSRAGLTGFLKAIGAGLGAGILGWIIYYGVSVLTGYEFGLIAIVVGYLIGRGVRWGSGNRGGAAFQALAVALTYVTIVSTYVPVVIEGIKKEIAKQEQATGKPAAATTTTPADAKPTTASTAGDATSASKPMKADIRQPPSTREVVKAFAMLGGLILALPFLAGASNIMGILIIGFALWEAWKLNRRTEIEVTGPFTPGSAAAK